jgi:hypothetical protein
LSYILLLLGGAGEWPARLDVRTNSDTLRGRDSSVGLPTGQSISIDVTVQVSVYPAPSGMPKGEATTPVQQDFIEQRGRKSVAAWQVTS